MARVTVTLEVAGLDVLVPAPAHADFETLEGLPEGEQNLSWSPGPGSGAFVVSTGGGPGHTADGFLAGERASADAVELVGDELLAGPAGPARRVELRSRRHEPRSWVQGDDGRPAEVPEHDAEEELAFLFSHGPAGELLRVGYRVPVAAPEGARALLREMLDDTRLERA